MVAAPLALFALSACAPATTSRPELVSIEFGQERFLTDAYLAATPGASCGHPFAVGGAVDSVPEIVEAVPGMVEVRAPLPDGTWFRVFMTGPGPEDAPTTIVLERGVGADEARLTMRLDEVEGIVRLQDEARENGRAWGVYSARADWLRDLGSRVRSLDCATG
jgi:hypothetical protein